MKKIVLSLGGSLIVPGAIQSDFLRSFRELIVDHLSEYRFVIFTGGGAVARTYMEGAREICEMTDEQLDWLGIHASRLNAQLVRQIFEKESADDIIIDPTLPIAMDTPITIGAGWKPGWSTDYDAVQVAVTNGIDRVVNLSNIKYVFDKDPSEFPDAKKIEDIGWADFRKIVGSTWKPGLNAPFDPIAAKLAEEHGIEVLVADGKNIANVAAILAGNEFEGTRIHP
ncbi:MAG: UMP kinase [Candidatus Kerfeldbacteria bacterium CG15_BIG_FIL_POST_REV_8_21_14_020_45_12]|uniref:UMP kinase n=1 Tax=Candidatus Kerfeldbacteria bacterium CG15_BIG_FIL_POST_REV_8_21_14_020_45_12 TaxID=2014247 RepID=A0A2M7H2K6_9BACT|nr:MAG: UMP kinase [Candidatus Kerfeldbacteria bacterium CG15_BIG_FIL_POST_REV_8_21_14_020_45_12]PJA93117.1 MAG: UMP kinase [Candidatus Kerfeldbacteria bacterium CG_4_9_14_3_um_filter_45_8]